MDASTHDGHARFRRVPLGILDLGVFAGTFLFRWLTVDFTNDHFVHLSRARQILLGDVPIRGLLRRRVLSPTLPVERGPVSVWL